LKLNNAAKKIDQSPLTIFADNSQLQLLPLPKMPIRLTPLKRPYLSLDTYKALCAAATEFGSLAPWEYMCDTALFGIQDAGQVRLGSVLGNDGEPSPSGLFVSPWRTWPALGDGDELWRPTGQRRPQFHV
jgi:hypothetical protein